MKATTTAETTGALTTHSEQIRNLCV
jgi:hypothetical protein